MHCHQRRRAGGVDGDGRAFETEDVGDATGQHRRRGAGDLVALGAAVTAAVLDVGGADERADLLAAQRGRVDARAFDGLPGGLEEQALLRVHAGGFARGDAEERRVEVARVGQVTAGGGVGGAGTVRVRVVHLRHVETAVRRELRDRVRAGEHHLPEGLRGVGVAGEAAAHADDRDRLVRVDLRGEDRLFGSRAQQFRQEVIGENHRGRVVEDQRGGQRQTGGVGQLLAQLDRGQRVEADVAERAVLPHLLDRAVAERRGGFGAHELDELALLVLFGQ